MATDPHRRAAKAIATTYRLAQNAGLFRPAYGIRDLAVARSILSVSSSNWVRFACLFSPVVLIALQSYFKATLIETANAWSPGSGVGLYWGIRVLLFAAFIAMLFKASPVEVKRPATPNDLYAAERSARDPLLGLRALACLNVFFGHWFMVVYGPSTPAETSAEYTLRAALSFSPWCGVWMFFTLSGYLMGKGFVTGRHSICREGLKKFYRNRVLRIFPIYFVSIFLVAMFMNPAALDVRNAASLNSLCEAMLFDQQTGGMIGALWSVSTEFQFYLLAPLLFLLIATCFKRELSRVAAALALCGLLAWVKFWILTNWPELWHGRVYFPLLLNLDCFIAGMTTAFLVNRMIKDKHYLPNGLAIGIAAALAAQFMFSKWSFHEMAVYAGYPGSATRLYYLAIAPGVTAVATCIVIGLFELSKRTPGKATILWRASATMGVLTYCLYVFHEPVILSLRRLFPATLTMRDAIVIFPFGLAASIAVAALFYYFVETRVDKARK